MTLYYVACVFLAFNFVEKVVDAISDNRILDALYGCAECAAFLYVVNFIAENL